jgi:hypothetical protein
VATSSPAANETGPHTVKELVTMPQRLSAQERLDRAYANYQLRLAEMRAIRQCTSWWPADGETRCDLLDGHACKRPQPHVHDANCGGLHRHKPKGMAVGVLTWDGAR